MVVKTLFSGSMFAVFYIKVRRETSDEIRNLFS